MGMALTTWASIEQGRNSLNERARLLLEKIYYVNPDYLLNGKMPMFLRPSDAPDEQDHILHDRDSFFKYNIIEKNLKNFREMVSPDDVISDDIRFRAASSDKNMLEFRREICRECTEKNYEISRLKHLLHRAENELLHQRKIIDSLLDIQKNQNKPD